MAVWFGASRSAFDAETLCFGILECCEPPCFEEPCFDGICHLCFQVKFLNKTPASSGAGDNGRFRGTFSPTDTLSDRFAVLANEVTRFWTELRNAYIQIALMGTNFCTSAKNAFFLILRNAFRFGTVAILDVTELKQTWVSFMFFGGEVGQNEIYDDIMTLRN